MIACGLKAYIHHTGEIRYKEKTAYAQTHMTVRNVQIQVVLVGNSRAE